MIATLIIIGIMMIASIAPGIVSEFNPPETVMELINLVGLIDLSSNIVPSIFFDTYAESYDLNIAIPIAWMIILTVGSIAATWRFYQGQR